MASSLKKQHKTTKENTSTLDITNDSKTSNYIIDIDDSPDVATWNKEVTKDHNVKDINISQEIKNKNRIIKISSKIPPTTTIGLRRKDNKGKDEQVDPANQKDVDKIYNSGGKLTDHANLFNNKTKDTKNHKGKHR
jgi:hypothetical protein